MVAPMINPYEPKLNKAEKGAIWGKWTSKRRMLYLLARKFPKLLPYFYRRSFLSGKHDRIETWLSFSPGEKVCHLPKTNNIILDSYDFYLLLICANNECYMQTLRNQNSSSILYLKISHWNTMVFLGYRSDTGSEFWRVLAKGCWRISQARKCQAICWRSCLTGFKLGF